jgi:hypothetical protein
VVAQVSSMKTSRCGFSPDCCARQARRAAATSGRSRSAACAVFFSRQPAGLEKAADRRRADVDVVGRQPDLELGDGDVGRCGQQRLHPFGVVSELRPPAAAHRIGLERACAPPALHQLDHAARADREVGRGRPARGAGLDRTHHPFPQIQRIRSRHAWLASSIQQPG